MLKKKDIILAVVFLLIFSQTFVFGQGPPDTWQPMGFPGLPSNIIRGVDIADIHHGIAVGDTTGVSGTGGLIFMTNSGTSWFTPQTSPDLSGIILYDVSCADAMNAIAVGQDSTILKTTDGGDNWTVVTSGGTTDLHGVVFLKHHTEPKYIGWAVGSDSTIIATSDGGNTWNNQASGAGASSIIFKEVDFIYDTAYKGVAVGYDGVADSGIVIITSDSGAAWNPPATYPPTANGLYGVSVIASTYLWSVGADGKIIYTNDWGSSWSQPTSSPLVAGDTLYGVDFFSNTEGWAVGNSASEGGIIIHTMDGGETWTKDENMDGDPNHPLYDLALASGDIIGIGAGPYGWAVGGDETNSGVCLVYPVFNVEYQEPNNITNDFDVVVSVVDSIDTTKYKIYSFEMQFIFDSTKAYPTDTTSFIDLSYADLFANPGQFMIDTNISYSSSAVDTIWVAGASDTSLFGSGELFRMKFDTTLAGFTLDPQINIEQFLFNEGLPGISIYKVAPPILYGDVDNSDAVDPTDAVLILQFRVHKEPGYGMLQGGGGSNAWTAADVSGMMGVTSYDAALILQWLVELITQFPAEMMSKSSPVYDNRLAELIVSSEKSEGSNIIVYQIETDKINGILSADLEISYDENLKYIGYEPTENTKDFIIEVAEGEEGLLYIAMANGKPLNEKAGLISLKFENKGDSEGDIQVVSAMLNETNVETIAALVPNKFELYQNFPNPFNPETEIRYQIPENTKVILKIYNIMGQEVRTLINEVKSAGSYSIKWDGKNNIGVNVSSGVYFYRIHAGDFISTKKMVFLK